MQVAVRGAEGAGSNSVRAKKHNEVWLCLGTCATAAGGRGRERKGVAAVAEREQLVAMRDAVTATGRALRRDVEVEGSNPVRKKQNKIEVWLSLVERYVREQITAFRSVNFQNAETP